MNHETNWIVSLVDQITGPARSATNVTRHLSDTVQSVTVNLDRLGTEARSSAEQAMRSHRDLTNLLQQEERRVESLTQELREAGDALDPLRRGRIEFDIREAETSIRRYREQLVEVNEELRAISNGPDTQRMGANWGEAVVVANQTMELIKGAMEGLEFTREIDNLRSNLQMMSEKSGEELDELTAKAFKLGKVFNESPEEIARAANAMTKQLGGTYEENFALIEAGFKKGANLNGDFLDQLKEYGPQLQEAGLSGAQSIALMAKAGKDGIFSDKAVDAIKEANLSLREMDKPQIEALKAVGIEAKELAGKTSFEAMQMISKAMDGASDQARQMVLTDIFKGAGEDAGKGFIEGLDTMDLDLNKIPSFKQSGEGINSFLADLQTSFANTFSSIGSTVMYLSPVITAVGSAIPIITTLSKVTWIAEAAQWAMNLAMSANPIGLIIIAIAALVAAIVWVANHTSGWGEAWKHTMNAAELIFKSFVAGVKANFDLMTNGVMIGLNYIKQGWYEFKEAVGIGDSTENENMLKQIEADTEARKEAIKKGYKEAEDLSNQAKEEMMLAVGSIKFKKDTEESGAKKKDEFDFKTLGGQSKKLDGKSAITADKTASASGSSSRIINMTLNVDNNFNVKDGGDFMSRKDEILDYVIGKMNDSMKDALIAAGS